MQLHEVLRVTKLRQEVKSQLPELVGSNDELALKGAELQVFTVKAMETDGDDGRKTV